MVIYILKEMLATNAIPNTQNMPPQTFMNGGKKRKSKAAKKTSSKRGKQTKAKKSKGKKTQKKRCNICNKKKCKGIFCFFN